MCLTETLKCSRSFWEECLGQVQSEHRCLIFLRSGTPSFPGSPTSSCGMAQDPHMWFVDQQRTHLSTSIILQSQALACRQLCLTHSFPFLLTARESQPCQASGLAGFLPKHCLVPTPSVRMQDAALFPPGPPHTSPLRGMRLPHQPELHVCIYSLWIALSL